MLLASAFRADVTWTDWPPPATDGRWYQDDLGLHMSDRGGIAISADTILRCGAVLAAIRFLADAWAMSPPVVIRRDGDRRTPQPQHPVQRLLRNPNAWQTGNRWRHVMMVWASTYGNAYSRILPGSDYFAGELRPIHPTRCKVIDQLGDGSLVYQVTPKGRPQERVGQEEILHFHGISTDGMSGLPIYKLIQNAVAIALLAEKHTSTFLRKGSRLAGVLVPKGHIEDEQRKELKESWNEVYGGVNATGTVAVLPNEVDFKPMAVDNQKAQLLELRDWEVGDILRFLGVPGVVVGYADKTATYASAKEFFESGGVKHCILPWITNVEAEEEKDLLIEGAGDFQIKHNLDVLLRANTKDRFESLFKATGRPWMTGNEARAIEDMNPMEDPSMDQVALPVNLEADPEPEEPEGEPEPKKQAPPPRQLPPPSKDDEEEEEQALRMRAEQLAVDAAARVVRREVAAIRGAKGSTGAAARFARDPEAWKAWCAKYYSEHATYVAGALHITEQEARAYADRQRDELLAGGVAATEKWMANVVPELAALALGG